MNIKIWAMRICFNPEAGFLIPAKKKKKKTAGIRIYVYSDILYGEKLCNKLF